MPLDAMQDLLHYLQDPAYRPFLWGVGFLLLALLLFFMPRRRADRGGVVAGDNSGQIITGSVGGNVVQNRSEPRKGRGIGWGSIFYIVASLSSIIGLGYAFITTP